MKDLRSHSDSQNVPIPPGTGVSVPCRRGRASQRGFTVIELLVVVTIIGILSATSFPLFHNIVRDQKVNRNATDLMSFYRMAKTRALGRGSAIVTRFRNPGPKGSIAYLEMLESVKNNTPTANGLVVDALPTSSCSGTTWEASYQGANGARAVTFRDMGTDYANNKSQPGIYDFLGPAVLSAQTGALTSQPFVELCFTPRGRTFIRYAVGAWFPLTAVPRIEVLNAQLRLGTPPVPGITRSIFLPPNGVPRLAL